MQKAHSLSPKSLKSLYDANNKCGHKENHNLSRDLSDCNSFDLEEQIAHLSKSMFKTNVTNRMNLVWSEQKKEQLES